MTSFQLVAARAFLLPVLIMLPRFCCGLDNGLARTPPLGWNSYMAGIHGEVGLKKVANFLVESGLRDLGYIYVNTDEGWELPTRDGEGKLQADPAEYPSGIAAFTRNLSMMGLKFGIYGAASGVSCGTRPGQLYSEDTDAQTYAQWGVSYLKSDNCATYALDPSVRFGAMRDALNRTGVHILFSIEPFSTNPDDEQSRKLANLWRVGVDISDNWAAILDRADTADKWAPLAGPGGWNDPDMIAVRNAPHFTLAENRVYFGLWALMKAPLLLSADLAALDKSVLSVIKNADVIAVNQDPLGVQARKLYVDGIPLPWGVGVVSCDGGAPPHRRGFASSNNMDTRAWSVERGINADYHLLKNLATKRCLSSTQYDGSDHSAAGREAAVLLPCNVSSDMQNWHFSRGAATVTSVVNKLTRGALAISNATLTATTHGEDTRPVTDQAYGRGGLVTVPLWDQPPCTARNCDDYDPSQMWYYSPSDGMLRHAQYVASMNHRLEGDGYRLTPKIPTWRHHCLAHTLSTGNFGSIAGTTEVWGGPLAGGNWVLGLLNRGDQTTDILATWAMFETPDQLAPEATMRVHNLWTSKDLGEWNVGVKIEVEAHDLVVLKLSPPISRVQ